LPTKPGVCYDGPVVGKRVEVLESSRVVTISSSTDDGLPVRCDVCGASSLVYVSRPPGDSVCPICGSFLWINAVVEITSRYLFIPDLHISAIVAESRDEVIQQIVDAIASERSWTEEQIRDFNTAILKREQLGSTGIGRGIAVPHASMDWIDSCTSAMAFVPGGVNFDSLDGELVHTVIMLASPNSQRGDHLRALERISRSVRHLGGFSA
jgi:PTS system fructose-specific IIA component/PTS system nitrogen regulatory IIA component